MQIIPKIAFDCAGVAAKIRKSVAAALPELADEVRKDSNFYAPMRTGTMISQSNIISMTGEMTVEVCWGVPYASYVYRGVSKKGKLLKYSKDRNPNAQKEWCAAAKKYHLADWHKWLDKRAKENYKNG